MVVIIKNIETYTVCDHLNVAQRASRFFYQNRILHIHITEYYLIFNRFSQIRYIILMILVCIFLKNYQNAFVYSHLQYI